MSATTKPQRKEHKKIRKRIESFNKRHGEIQSKQSLRKEVKGLIKSRKASEKKPREYIKVT